MQLSVMREGFHPFVPKQSNPTGDGRQMLPTEHATPGGRKFVGRTTPWRYSCDLPQVPRPSKRLFLA